MSWTDPEKRREYNRKYRIEHPEKYKAWRAEHKDNIRESNRRYRLAHREEINAKRRKTKTNIPAGDGTITVDLDKRDSWNRKARSAEDVLFHAEFGMGYDEMEKYRRIKEYE